MSRKFTPILIHILIISSFILLETGKYLFGALKVDILQLTIYYIYDISYFYVIGYGYLPYTYKLIKSKTWRLLIALTAIPIYWIALVCYRAFVHYCYGLPFSLDYPLKHIDLIILRGSLIFGFAYLLWHNKFVLRIEKEQNHIRERNLALENDLLRSQINPHLINNALGLVHEHMIRKSPRDAEILEILGEMTSGAFIRSGQKGLIPLYAEIESINRYIRLHSLMKDVPTNFQPDYTIADGDVWHIPPHLLLEPIVNLLKYADFSDPKSEPHASIMTLGNQLLMEVTNKKLPNLQTPTHHFGMDNMKKRLSLYYPDAHTLTVIESESTYSLILTVQL